MKTLQWQQRGDSTGVVMKTLQGKHRGTVQGVV